MILAFVEPTGATLGPGTEPVLAIAADLAARRGVPAAAVVAAGAPGPPGPEPPVQQLAAHGVSRLYVLRHELLAAYSPGLVGDAVADLIADVRPEAVLAAGDQHGGEVMAHAAARLGLPLASHCTALRPGPTWEVTRERSGGILLEDAEVDGPVRLCTLAPGAGADIGPAPGPVADVAVETVTPDLDAAARHAVVVERRARSAGVGLATAPVVVSGGRGVGSAEGYAALEELAELLGGAVGCSRVATNNGWRPHRDQVGLTGTRITPELYVACGISGATQHWVGCMGSKAILAVNTDPEAPMVTRATWAVIGDVHEVLPAVIAEIRRRVGGVPAGSSATGSEDDQRMRSASSAREEMSSLR